MPAHRFISKITPIFVLVLASVFAVSTFGQTTTAQPDVQKKDIVAVVTNTPEVAVQPAETKTGGDGTDEVQRELAAVKAENAAVKEEVRKMQEQQEKLLKKLDQVERILDGSVAKDRINGTSDVVERTSDNANPSTGPGDPKNSSSAKQGDEPEGGRYQDGIIVWKTKDDAPVPFLLRFNNNTQIRFLNTQDSEGTFTDHLGVVRAVNTRNDITVNRAMFIFGGYIWDQRLRYSLTVWTSAGSNSIVVAGNIGWQFNKMLTVTGGYFGVPGSRSLVNTFPYFASTDRTMADNFFRPAFTQGVQFNGDLTKDWHYLALVGNGLNTLNISAAKIDENLTLSGSTWWEPLGAYAPPGKSVNMYDDYYNEKKIRIRLGTSFTRSREDRFSNLDTASPENVALHNSDGVLTFATGAFAPGVTLQKALYKMWAVDWGLKYDGLAINGQYYSRWLSEFEADGPLPLSSTFDHGFDMSVGHFFVKKKLMGYVRGSMIFGEFNNSHEYAGGAKWHPLPTERWWLQAELMRVHRVPYGGTFTPYTAGLSGWVPMVQTVIGF